MVLFQAHGYDPLDEPPALQARDEKAAEGASQQPPQLPRLQATPGVPNVVAEINFQFNRRYTRDMLRTLERVKAVAEAS